VVFAATLVALVLLHALAKLGLKKRAA